MVSRTVGNVVAGVGNTAGAVVPGRIAERQAPVIDKYASDEAFEAYKSFNTDLNLKLNKLREWQGYLSTAVFWMFGSAMTLATAGLFKAGAAGASEATLGALTAGLTSTPFLVVMAATVVLGTIKMVMSQYITKVQTEKGMDVGDFHQKREAELVGKEVAKHIEVVQDAPQAAQNKQISSEASPCVEAISHEGQVAHRGQQAGITYH